MTRRAPSDHPTLFPVPAEESRAKTATPASTSVPQIWWPAAWERDRAAVTARLRATEIWSVTETAFYLRVSPDTVVRNIRAALPNGIKASNIASLPDSRPLYRVERDSVIRFWNQRKEDVGL